MKRGAKKEKIIFAEEVTTTSTTEEPTTTTTTATTYQCAVWTRYNEDNAPATNGFLAGTAYLTNTDSYVGRGLIGISRVNTRIQLTTTVSGITTRTPGGYGSWGSAEIKLTYSEYLVVPSGCSCNWIDPAVAINRPGVVFTGDPYWLFAIGRKTVSSGKIQVTRVVLNQTINNYYLKQWYVDESNLEHGFDTPTEMLVCEQSTIPTGPPLITFPTESCGVWSAINMVNTVSTNGFSAGISRVGNQAWIGRGQQSGQFQIGRYQDEIPTGTYTAVAADTLADHSEWLIVPQGCYCKWTNLFTAKTKKGLMTAPDSLNNFMVGKVSIGSSKVSISRVSFTTSFQYYTTALNIATSDLLASEVLVCETTP